MIEGQMNLLELKRSHPIMNYWSNQDYTHFLEKALIQKDIDKSQINTNYLLIKHNSNEFYGRINQKNYIVLEML